MSYLFESIQEVGQRYRGPIACIKAEYQADLRDHYEIDLEDQNTPVVGTYFEFDTWTDVQYYETDYDEYEEFVQRLFGTKYDMYLEYVDHGNWRGSEGIRFVARQNCLTYSEDCSLDYVERSPQRKLHHFTYANHDVYCANSYYIGLTDREYQQLQDTDTSSVCDWAREKVAETNWVQKW